jgi:hypothetical protein
VLRRLVPSAYRPVLAHRVFRRLIVGFAVSSDNVLRAVFLGAIPLAWLAGVLTLPLYVVLLAISSLLPPERHLAPRAAPGPVRR